MIGNNIFLASDDNWTKIVNINVDDFNIGEISCKIVKEIYLYFGMMLNLSLSFYRELLKTCIKKISGI